MNDGPKKFIKKEVPSRVLKRYSTKFKATNPIRLTKEYQDFQKEQIQLNPVCARIDCKEPSTDIHHKIRITEQPELVLDPENIICICKNDHILIESAVNRNVDPEIYKHLFKGL